MFRPRRALAAALALLGVLTSGCQPNPSSSSLHCRLERCSLTFTGETGSEWLDPPRSNRRIWFRYDGVRDGRAHLNVSDQRASCAQGDRLRLGGLDLTCTDVGDQTVTVEWTWP